MWGGYDWDQHLAFSESSRQTILRYRQFPLWDPFRCGGITDVGQPQNRFFSPLFLVILLFGSPVGYKIIFVLQIIIAAGGAFILARRLGTSHTGSLLAAIIFSYSGIFTAPFAAGMTNFMNLTLVPWLVICVNAIGTKKTFSRAFPMAVALSLVLTLMFFGGWSYMPMVGLSLLIISGALSIQQRRWHPFFLSALALFIFVGISAIKLFPSIETVSLYPRVVAAVPYDGYSVKSFLFSLFSRQQTFSGWQRFTSGGVPASFDFEENGMYVGVLALVLFLIGLIRKARSAQLLFPLILFLWLIFGVNISPSLYRMVRALPLFPMMMVAQRYKYFFLIFFALSAGFGFDALEKGISTRSKRVVLPVRVGIVLFIFIDLWVVNTSVLSAPFQKSLPNTPKSAEFRQVRTTPSQGTNRVTTYRTGVAEYPVIYAHYGSVDCYESLPVGQSAVKGYQDGAYRGEVYLSSSSVPIRFFWSPNIIRVTLEKKLLAEDTVVVNQNYDQNWWVIRSNRVERAGRRENLLAAPIDSTDSTITFLYFPLSFLYGTAVTLGTSFLVMRFLKTSKDRRHAAAVSISHDSESGTVL